MPIKKMNLPNGIIRWEVVDRLPGSGEKQIRRRFEKRVDAQEFVDSLKQRKREFLHPNSIKPSSDIEGTTFNGEADYWLEKKGAEFTPGYFRSINPCLKKVRKLFGHFPISKFTPTLLFEFRQNLKREGLSPATQNRYADIVTRIINFSFKQRRISYNPCFGYEKARESREEMLFWDEDEVQRFLGYTNAKYPRGSEKRWIYCVYLLALETGMRARELWGLKLSDLPANGTKIKVLRQSLGGNTFAVTKGKDSRYVPFSQGMREELNSMLMHENRERKPDSTLFLSQAGSAMDHDNFKERVFKKDMTGCGIKPIRFHDLRHTSLTLMVKKGVLLPVIQKIAGHKDIKTTMRYVHVMGKDIEEIGAMPSLRVTESSEKLLKLM